MNTFKQYLDEDLALDKEIDELDEVLGIRARMRMKQSMRKNKSKIKMGARRAKKRTANTTRLKSRSNRSARREIMDKILKGKKKSDLSYGARAGIERRVNKRGALIRRLAKRMLPAKRKADRAKFRSKG
jgi:hypothetical protein|tara:strand:+ start:993 stop:1379 length:387 start_codon:yes stop_codon:yes gene_type:complete